MVVALSFLYRMYVQYSTSVVRKTAQGRVIVEYDLSHFFLAQLEIGEGELLTLC